MAFEKKDWNNDEVIKEADLDRIENGIDGAYIKTVTVKVDNNTGTPSATGTVSGNTLTLDFKNLKGAKGDTGAAGQDGAQGPQGEPGPKGDTGAQGPAGAGLTGEAAAIEELSTETATDMKNKINEIITQLKARGVTA